MDTDNTPSVRPTSAQGGTVEPVNRATIAKERFQTPIDRPAERYELRDPFAEVTYRADNFADIAAKADQLGSSRFISLDAQGRRTTVQKVNGEWQRGPQLAAAPERPVDTAPVRDNLPQTTKIAPSGKSQQEAEAADSKVIAGIDAKAERAALVARLEAALGERYVIKRAPATLGDTTIGRTEYRFRGDTSRVAFTESTFRLATDTNSPSVARSMVDVAEARNWRALRVSGNEEFKRMVWLEASVRGVKSIGYEPNPADLEVLKREREARLVNRIEPAPPDGPAAASTAAEKASVRGGGGGRKAVLAAIEAVLVAKGVPEKQREAVMVATTEKLAQRTREGQSIKIKVFDKAAPSQRTVVAPTSEVQRTRERAAPVR
jgi:hypothetical protein